MAKKIQRLDENTWWDIRLPHTTRWGPSSMSEDSAYMAPDISGWLLANSYPFNAGYAKTGVSNLTNKGYRSWEFYPYVRLYTIDHARHFALVWR